jgi:hypothetical protein
LTTNYANYANKDKRDGNHGCTRMHTDSQNLEL